MSEPQQQPHEPTPSNLAWFGLTAGAGLLSWIASSILLVFAHRTDGAGPAAVGACVAAGTLTIVATVLGCRYAEQRSIAAAVAEAAADNLEEHRQIITSIQQLQLRLARLEANTERLIKIIPDAIEQSRWHGRADILETTDGAAPVIQIGHRRN